MAEVGLVPFARLALKIATAVLPRYRTRFSKRQFTQPQLLAILCLMRYEDGTFREAEVRLREHSELRRALGLRRVPDHTTMCRFLFRLPEESIGRALAAAARRFPRRRRRARVAVDATGLSSGAISNYFVRRLYHHSKKPLPWRHWLKWLIVADLDEQLILSQTARRGPWNDCASLRPLLASAHRVVPIGLALADAEFDSEKNHSFIRHRLKAQSVIPAKRGKKTWRVRGVRAEMRRAFAQRLYRRRALTESVISSAKRKLSARAPGRTLTTQVRQALLLGLSFNLYRLKHPYLFLRMSTEPSRLMNARNDSMATGRVPSGVETPELLGALAARLTLQLCSGQEPCPPWCVNLRIYQTRWLCCEILGLLLRTEPPQQPAAARKALRAATLPRACALGYFLSPLRGSG